MSTILHLITGLGSGGAERMLTHVATQGSASNGARQVVVCLIEEGMHVNGPVLKKAGVPVHCLGMQRGRLPAAACLRLFRLLRQERPDILMTWLYHADLLGTLIAPLARVRRIIWNVRCSEVDFARYRRTTRWTSALLSRLSTRPWAVGVNSHAGRQVHEALGYRAKRWSYLPNGVDVSEWRPDPADRASVREELGLRPHEIGFVMVARVDPMKDHESLLGAVERVVAKHPEARFFLIGRGTEAFPIPGALAGAVTALGERTDVQRLLRGLDVGVLSSRGEGFPNVVAEAMATGLPYIATDVGDAAMIIAETGMLVPARDPAALASAIEGLLAEGTESLQQRGRQARDRIVTHWSIERAIRAYQELWQEALGVK